MPRPKNSKFSTIGPGSNKPVTVSRRTFRLILRAFRMHWSGAPMLDTKDNAILDAEEALKEEGVWEE